MEKAAALRGGSKISPVPNGRTGNDLMSSDKQDRWTKGALLQGENCYASCSYSRYPGSDLAGGIKKELPGVVLFPLGACLKNVNMPKRRLFFHHALPVSLKYIQYSCVKLASSGEKISRRRAHFHFSNSAQLLGELSFVPQQVQKSGDFHRRFPEVKRVV